MRNLLEDLDVQTVDALEVGKRYTVTRLGGWELKAYALLHSRFREVLLLDADNVPVRNPEYLFDTPDYTAAGTLFWPTSCGWRATIRSGPWPPPVPRPCS